MAPSTRRTTSGWRGAATWSSPICAGRRRTCSSREDPGALYVLHGPRGLVAEVSAGPALLRLAVPAGRYEIERRGSNGRARGDLGVARGEERLVPVLQPTRYEVARTKGGPRQAEAFAGVGAHLVAMPGGGVAPAVRGGVRREVGPAGLLVTLEYALADVTDGALKYEYSRLGGDVALVLPVAGGRRLVEAGAFAGWGWATQTLRDRRTYHAGDATAGFLVRTSVPIGRLRGAVDLTAGGRAFELNGARVVRPAGSLSFAVLYGF